MSQDKPGVAAPGSIKSLAAELYGLKLDDAAAARIAADLARLDAGAASAGPAPLDAEPGALFRQLLLGTKPSAAGPA